MSEQAVLPATWKVPQVFRDRLGQRVGRQRAMLAEGHLLLVLHEPPKPDEEHRRARFAWRAPDGTWNANFSGSGIAALRRHIDDYARVLAEIDLDEDKADRADDYFGLLRRISPLRRAARNMYDTFQQARQMVPGDRELITCRDHAYGVHRSAELLSSDIQSGLDCAVARRAEEQAASSYRMALAGHRLNVLAAVFFPIATVAAVFGMNLGHGLEGQQFTPWLFWAVLLFGVLSGLLLKAAILETPERPQKHDPVKQV